MWFQEYRLVFLLLLFLTVTAIVTVFATVTVTETIRVDHTSDNNNMIAKEVKTDNKEGVPCVCYDNLDCFPVRPECGENNKSPLPNSPSDLGTRFLLFTSKKPQSSQLLNYSTIGSEFIRAGFDTAVETKVLIHGFTDNADSPAVKSVKDAFLKMGKYNTIIVEWQSGSDYPQAVQNTRIVAKQIQLFLQHLSNEVGVPIGSLHMTGHSLGAHVAGLAGAHLAGAVGRITGLDPAGPSYRDTDPSCRIDAGDAVFVDIIHTAKTTIGIDIHCGDIDFWPNDGCCSHSRAYEYFAVSIEGLCIYNTVECGSTSCSDCPIMGINADKSSKRGNYCISTGTISPFC
ncbi:pancreatic lipase-related protein 2-like isoform X2 [Amphiura filiformis]|uniref:pancreatic lipase-related protein 2-like isoform X2 n=1 Tax=Amphiura filiformis TaxID=82378 RepID=UPI003B218811